MLRFDENYYKKFCSGTKGYNVAWPVRKALRQCFYPLPSPSSVSDFAIGYVGNFVKWRKYFDIVYGYDINETVAVESEQIGMADYFRLQDVSVPFAPIAQTNICTCFYLFEHISDEQVVGVVANMVKTAPLNAIGITSVSDRLHYQADPTHINPKPRRGWNSFLVDIYDMYGWKRFALRNNYWFFAPLVFHDAIESIHAQIGFMKQVEWEKINSVWQRDLLIT